MRLLGYELVKLFGRRVLLVLAAALILGGTAMCFASQRGTEVYFYIHERREDYLSFAAGDASADDTGWYSRRTQEWEKYRDSYNLFVGEMADRVERLSGTSLFSDKDSFVYRNLIKTQADYASFEGVVLQAGNDFGVQGYAGFDGGIIFTLAFLAILTYYVLFDERGQNLLLLLKGTRRGHAPLAVAKLGAMLTAASLYTVAQELALLGLFGWLYGFGDLARAAQSVSVFRNCVLHISLGDALALTVAVRVGVTLVLATFLYAVGASVRSEAAAAVLSGVLLGLEALFYAVLGPGSSLRALKFINLFYCWTLSGTLGEYQNLNFFGYPMGKGAAALTAGTVALAVCAGTGATVFSRKYQVKTSGVFQQFAVWLRGRASGLFRTVSLVWFELHKLLLGQKKMIALVLLLLWGYGEIRDLGGPRYFAKAEDAAYSYYTARLQGPVTQETLDRLESEVQRLDGLYAQLEALQSSGASEGEIIYESAVLGAQIDLYEGGLKKVLSQVDWLRGLPGALGEKYLVNEEALKEVWYDNATDTRLWLIGCIAAMFFISGIRTWDEKQGMTRLLRTTLRGRRGIDRARRLTALILTLAVFAAAELPVLLRYGSIGVFHILGQRLCWFTGGAYTSGCTIGLLMATVFAMKLVPFLGVSFLGEWLTRWTKSSAVTFLVGAGVIGVVGALLLGLEVDITTVLLDILG